MAGRSRRRSAEETRSEMVSVGLRVLQESGLDIGMDAITLESACIAADIPRSSSYAAWALDGDFMPQESFRRAVLEAWLVDRRGSAFLDAAQAALEHLYERVGQEPSKPAIVRALIQAAFLESSDDGDPTGRHVGDYVATDMAIHYSIASQPSEERDDGVLDWLREGDELHRSQRIEDAYKPFGELVDVRPKAELGEKAFALFAIAVASLFEGISLRHSIHPELGLDQPMTDAVDDGVPTLMIGACVEALVPVFFDTSEDD